MLRQLTSTKSHKSKATGDEGELLAVKFLEQAGFKILQRNYRYDRGEIDIVAEDNSELVFVEVKSRHTQTFGTPEDAITLKKESYLKRTAEGYLFQHNLEDKACRFDVIAVDWNGGQPEIRHIKKVF
jgi:putative endonuclease